MQYHFNGFRAGDPRLASEVAAQNGDGGAVDVLIVGCGPAGLVLAAQMAQFPQISVRIVDRRAGPLEIGQADGIACRSMEMFEAFGFAGQVKDEAYWVNETAFWRPDGTGIRRADRIDDVEYDLSEMPHVILSQARVHDFLLDVMALGARRLVPDYSMELKSMSVEEGDYPVVAHFEDEVIRARYLVGCDGARSAVRGALGYALEGEAARQLWGVMDVLPVTDFPDIRLKCAIQSEGAGSLLIIPREGGAMVRMYIELDALDGDERASDRNVTAEMLIEKAAAVLAPYTLDVREVAWFSAYEIGQRVCRSFDDGQAHPRVFIAGDACHTHSPKAGQGMNVSMADTFNLGWKLASVLEGRAAPSLLGTYSQERQAKAQELIDFDKDMARLFASRDGADESEFQRYFQKHGRYTAGVETTYGPSMIVGPGEHQGLAVGQRVGKRFHSAPVVRLADAKPMQLGHAFKADGRWRVVLFAPQAGLAEVSKTCAALMDDARGAVRRFTPKGADLDSVIDVRAVFQEWHREMDVGALPRLLLPAKGRLGLTDYEKAFCPDSTAGDIFEMRGIDRARGAMVVLRPDQFVAGVLPLSANAALHDFFGGFMVMPE